MTIAPVQPSTAPHAAMLGWMQLALAEARRALESGEAPIGCVVLSAGGDMLGAGHNTLLASGNPTLHAEMNAFAAAFATKAPAKELVMVSTLEPCVMCTGAAMQAGVTTIIYGLRAPADAGTGRVSPPTSPNATSPVVIGEISATESRSLFVEWMTRHDGDASRDEQRAFIAQLLALTAAPAT